MTRRGRLWILFVLAPIGMLLFVFLGGQIVMRLWNGLLPTLFGWPRVTFWQALGLLVLCRILFGGFGLGGGSARRRRMGERWEKMSPEEREHLRQGVRERSGTGPGMPSEA